jgi:hypothetical protein
LDALLYVRSFKSTDRPLAFFHIPKTAGTAVEEAGGRRGLTWGSCLFNHKPKRDVCEYPDGKEWPKHVGWWHVPRQYFPLANVDPYRGAELFAVVRDPYDRMLSEFYYICTLRVFDWRPDQCDRTRLFDAAYLNEWLQRKLSHKDSGTASSYLADNGHFTPQHDYVVGPHQVRVIDHVLRMDGAALPLSEQFDRLMRAFSLGSVRLESINALGAESRRDVAKLDTRNLAPDTLEAIHATYDSDFALGYARRSTPGP